ncbi:kinase-like domain-containing protein [Gongronella butleri]|nr:kinase-like domain-containing protein [Gongronella butleri]
MLFPVDMQQEPEGDSNTSTASTPHDRFGFLKSLFHHENRDSNMTSSCSPKIDHRQQHHDTGTPLTPPTEQEALLPKVTTELCQTYERCNADFTYDRSQNPRRVLTKPGTPCNNNGFDNAHHDFVLFVHGLLGGRYLVLEMLGSGTFGQVAKCRDITNGKKVAVKVIKNKPAYLKQSKIEVEILKLLNEEYDKDDNHHILRLKEHFKYKHHLCLVFELMSVNLYHLMKQNSFKGLSLDLVRSFTTQILDALIVLKKAGVMHCDLKPENILLTGTNASDIKVIDFGSACHESRQLYTYIQSRFYRSPEVLLGTSTISTAIDMWSFGCIVAELFLGLPLFPGSSEYDQLSRIIATLGLPPNEMIEDGKNSKRYFNETIDDQGRTVYSFKPKEQYCDEQDRVEKPSKKYFSTTFLPSLIMDRPINDKSLAVHEEISIRKQMLDFLKRVLVLDPTRRLTPSEAMKHPFVLSATSTHVVPSPPTSTSPRLKHRLSSSFS